MSVRAWLYDCKLGMLLLYRARQSIALRLVAVAVFLGIFALTLMDLLHRSAESLLDEQASRSMGADVIISSSRPISPNLIQKAQDFGLQTALVTSLFTMVKSERDFKLVSLKAVSAGYPLTGDNSHEEPAEGTLLVDHAVLSALQVDKNQKVQIGRKSFTIADVLSQEGAFFDRFQMAPKVIIHMQDLSRTGIIQPGSQVNYELWVMGTQSKRFYEEMVSLKDPDLSLSIPSEGQSPIQRFVRYAQAFLAIILILSVGLSAAALSFGMTLWLRAQKTAFKLYSVLGMPQEKLFRSHALAFFCFAMIMAALGVGFAYMARWGLGFQTLFPLGKVVFSIKTLFLSFGTLLLFMVLLVYPQLKEADKRQSWFEKHPFHFWGALLILSCALLYIYLGQMELILRLMGGIGWSLFLAYFLFQLSLWCLGRIRGFLSLRYALRFIHGRPTESSGLGVLLALGVFLFFVLQGLERDILKQWQQSLSPQTPNHFLINIAPDDLPELKLFLQINHIEVPDFYPVLRARLTHINGQRLIDDAHQKGRAGFHRPLNLTWSNHLPDDNHILTGKKWIEPLDSNALSIEDGFAKRLNIKVNDRLTFQINGEAREGKVWNIRTVSWQSFRPNFFVIFRSHAFDQNDATYIGSFYAQPSQENVSLMLNKKFPEVSVLEIGPLIASLQSLVQWFSKGISALIGVVFGMGLILFIFLMMSSKPQRAVEASFLRLLGTTKTFVFQVLAIEFILLGLIGSLVGAVTGAFTLQAISLKYFDFYYKIDGLYFVSVVGVSTLSVFVLGWFVYRSVPRQSPLVFLKRQS